MLPLTAPQLVQCMTTKHLKLLTANTKGEVSFVLFKICINIHSTYIVHYL